MDLNEKIRKILKDPILSNLSSLAKEKHTPLFLVGGYVRDLFLGTLQRVKKDYDFTLPKENASFIAWIEQALQLRFFRVGKEENDTITYRTIQEHMSIDLTFLQGDGIEEDLKRRDFTMNAIAFSLKDEAFYSVGRALEDIEKRVIRTVSNHSIEQDPLRMLRAIRYLCTLDGFVMDEGLKEEISQKKELTQRLPGERIKMELDHILLSPQPALGMRSLDEVGLLLTLFPELTGLEGLAQNEHHHLNVLSHLLLMVEKISWAFQWLERHGKEMSLTQEDRLALYYAALFHDLGKKDTYSRDAKGKVHFYHHESFSCQSAEEIMERLRFSHAMRSKILRLIQHHMRILNLSRDTKDAALKRLVHHMAEETPLLVLLTLADKEASRGILSIQVDGVVEGHCLRILQLFHEKEIVHPLPLITGHDVMALGISPGPEVGHILNFIREKQIEGEINTREEALKMLRERFGN